MSVAAWQFGHYVTTDLEAEQMAAAAMRGMGYADARETPPGPDGGIDVRATGAIAQVKFRGAQAGRSELQRLVGARGREIQLSLFFFVAAGFSIRAIEYAAELDIALFVYDPMGRLTALSPAATRSLSPAATRSLITAAPAPPSPAKLWWKRNWWRVATIYCWVSFVVQLVQGVLGSAIMALGFAIAGTVIWRRRSKAAVESSHRAGADSSPRL